MAATKSTTAASVEAAAKDATKDAARTAEEIAAAGGAPADPAPATELVQPSGAIAEPEVLVAVDVGHESVDANPRIGTSAQQNAIDFNDAKRADPSDPAFAGQGVDLSVYGDAAAAAATGEKA